MLYLQRLSGEERTRVITMTDVVGARLEGNEIVLDLLDRKTGRRSPLACDVVLLGSGFEKGLPAVARRVAETLQQHTLEVNRAYRVVFDNPGRGAIYLQGVSEETHGIGDSLLSVLAHRSQEIVDDILARRRYSWSASSDLLPTARVA